MPLSVEWEEAARADVLGLDRETARRLLRGLNRYLRTQAGDVVKLQGFDPARYRLRVGNYRVICAFEPDTIRVLRVLHRREAYR